MVRPYTVTRGRTLPDAGAADADVIAVVSAESDRGDDGLSDEGCPDDGRSAGGHGGGGRGEGEYGDGDQGDGGHGDPCDATASDAGEPAEGAPGAVGCAFCGGGTGDAVGGTELHGFDALDESHLSLLDHCRERPLTVAELASHADLPLGVVRVLLGDLLRTGRVHVTHPAPPEELPDVGLLRHVISGLKSL